jgi:hypothetical protein
MLEACICIEDLSLSPRKLTLEIEVTAKTIEKNSMSKSPLKTSDQNFLSHIQGPFNHNNWPSESSYTSLHFWLKTNHGSTKIRVVSMISFSEI